MEEAPSDLVEGQAEPSPVPVPLQDQHVPSLCGITSPRGVRGHAQPPCDSVLFCSKAGP